MMIASDSDSGRYLLYSGRVKHHPGQRCPRRVSRPPASAVPGDLEVFISARLGLASRAAD
jgi:hypothetical protein